MCDDKLYPEFLLSLLKKKFQGPNQPVFKIFASIKTFQFLNYLKRGEPFEFILERLNKVS